VAEMHVELVAPDRLLWSGDATFVFARTTEGEIGILPHHIPLVAELTEGEMVRIDKADGDQLFAAVHGGFLSVTERGVSILAEGADLREEIDEAAARRDLDSEDPTTQNRAKARLRALGNAPV
jgi:F-type H+-transporting ATPase subunit epsilon